MFNRVMVATELAAPATLALIGGIGAIEVIVLVGLLLSTGMLFVAISNEFSTGKSLIISCALYIGMAGYALLLLN